MMNFRNPGSFRRLLELLPFFSPSWLHYQYHITNTMHVNATLTFLYPYLRSLNWDFKDARIDKAENDRMRIEQEAV
jgi:hypothetical protein